MTSFKTIAKLSEKNLICIETLIGLLKNPLYVKCKWTYLSHTLWYILHLETGRKWSFHGFFKKPMIGSKNVSITDNTANDIVDFDLIHSLNFYYILHTNIYLCDYQYKENIILIEDLY